MSDPMKAWRAHVGGTAWPTVALAIGALSCWLAAVLGHATGALALGLAAPIAMIAAYVSFTPLHEAVHGNIGGRERPWLDTLLGWLSAIPFLSPYPAFRALHLRHHARTNHPEDDPDMWVAGTGLRLVIRCLTVVPHFYRVFLGPLAASSSSAARARPAAITYPERRSESLLSPAGGSRPWTRPLVGHLPRQAPSSETRPQPSLAQPARSGILIGALVILGVILGGAVWLGFATTVLFVVLVPSWLATAVLVFFFDWLPHHPHTAQGRYRDTRAVESKVLEVLLLSQNLHLIHHLWPSVPWYRYGAVLEISRDALRSRGAPIEPLRDLIPDRTTAFPSRTR